MLVILLVCQFVMSIGAYAWGPLAPFLIEDFQISRTQIGFITSVTYIVATVIAIPGGMLVDRFGSHILLIACMLLMGTPFALMGLVEGYGLLLLLAGCSGLGYGLINQASTKGLIHWFPVRIRATAMGIKQTGVSLGGAAAAVIFPLAIYFMDWQTVLFGVGITMLLLALIAAFFYRDKPPASSATLSESTDSKPTGEPKKSNPIALVLNNRPLFIVIAIFPFLAFAQISVTSFLLLYLTEQGFSSMTEASSCLTLALIGGTVGRLTWGTLADRFFNSDITKACVLLALIGLIASLCLTFMPVGTHHALLLAASFFAGFSLIGWNAALMAVVVKLSGQENAGAVMGVAITVGWIGVFSAPPVFGFIADTSGYFGSWVSVSICALISLIGFLYLQQHQAHEQTDTAA